MSSPSINAAGSGDLDALTTAGAVVARDAFTKAITLATGTYYIPVGGLDGVVPGSVVVVCVQLKCNAALAGTVTFEDSCFPQKRDNATSGPDDVSNFSTTAGDWMPFAPTTADVAVLTGITASGTTLTVGGTAASGARITFTGFGGRRLRLKVVVTTGGTLRVNVRGKGAA